MKLTIGQTLKATATFTPVNSDIPEDPTTVYAVVTDPNGASVTYTYLSDSQITRLSTGVYLLALQPTVLGWWTVQVYGTGDVTGGAFGQFEVVSPSGVIVPDELADYLCLELTAAMEQRMAVIIDGLVGELEAWLGRPITVTERTETHKIGVNEADLYLWATPVVSVSSVELLDRDGNVSSVFAASDYVVWDDSGRITYGSYIAPHPFYYASGSFPGQAIRVTYIGGLDGRNIDAIRGLLLRVAAREWQAATCNTAGLTAFSVEGTSMSFQPGWGQGFTREELRKVSRYKRYVVVG